MAQRLVKRQADVYYIGGENLKNHRLRVGLSQQKVAERMSTLTGLEIERWRISEWERSFEFSVNALELAAIKKILKI